MNSSEQRRHPRVNVEFFADWGWGPGCENYDKITSLSLSGCFLARKRDLNRGDQIYLRLSSESSGVISLRGCVVYQLVVMDGALSTGVGVEFNDISNDSQVKLQQIMKSSLELA